MAESPAPPPTPKRLFAHLGNQTVMALSAMLIGLWVLGLLHHHV